MSKIIDVPETFGGPVISRNGIEVPICQWCGERPAVYMWALFTGLPGDPGKLYLCPTDVASICTGLLKDIVKDYPRELTTALNMSPEDLTALLQALKEAIYRKEGLKA